MYMAETLAAAIDAAAMNIHIKRCFILNELPITVDAIICAMKTMIPTIDIIANIRLSTIMNVIRNRFIIIPPQISLS